MIFVITGTEQFPFDRLIQAIDRLKYEDVFEDDVFVQLGSCVFEPKHCSWQRFISYSEMLAHIKNASLIICHAGAGTTLLCLKLAKRPILVPRMTKYAEHVDDHQVIFAKNFEESGRVDVVFDVKELETIVKKRLHEEAPRSGASDDWVPKELTKYLNSLLRSWD